MSDHKLTPATQLRAFWERPTTRKLRDAAAIAIAVHSETESDTDSDADSDADAIATAAHVCNHAHVPSLPDFDVVAVLFLAAVANWLAILALDVLPLVLLAIHGRFTRLGAPLLTTPTARAFSRALSRAFALATAVTGLALRWGASRLLDHPNTLTITTAATDAITNAGVRGSKDTSRVTENVGDATPKICVLLFSSESGSMPQRANVNRTRDLLCDMDLQFVEMDVATTIDVRDQLLQRDLREVSNVRTYPQVFTLEMADDKSFAATQICFITPTQLETAEHYLGTPVTELARLSVYHLSAHCLFAGVPKHKASKAVVKPELAPHLSVSITQRTTTDELFESWLAPLPVPVLALVAEAEANAATPRSSAAPVYL